MFRQTLLLLTVVALVLAGWAVNAQAQGTAKTVVTPVPADAMKLQAQPEGAAQGMSFDTFVKGAGVMAYPLIILSMVAFFLILLYTLTIRQGTVVSDAFMNSADALIRKQDYLGLLSVCNRRNECIARITAKTLDFATRNPTASFEEVKEVTEAEGNRQSSLLLSRIAYLGGRWRRGSHARIAGHHDRDDSHLP